MYLSYENESNNWVNFDDFKVTHTKTNVIQYNEYYPFGLQASTSWTRENNKNDFLYNAGSEINVTSGWYDLPLRNYDPALGRFVQVDPMSTSEMATYQYGGNQLQKVDDIADKTKGFTDGPNPDSDYVYDANGNMTLDRNKFITAITYNHLNLPEKVTKNTGDYIKYVYDASGRKLSQGVYNATNILKKKTDYAGEFFYENDTLKFINHEEGRIVMKELTPEYQYHMKDHLFDITDHQIDVVKYFCPGWC